MMMGGFGALCPQLYCKVEAAFTALHNEMAGSSAMNYMMSYSTAIALWIGMNLDEMVMKLTLMYFRKDTKPHKVNSAYWTLFNARMKQTAQWYQSTATPDVKLPNSTSIPSIIYDINDPYTQVTT